MIGYLNTYGFFVWGSLIIMLIAVILAKVAEGNPTSDENALILQSTEHRGKSFLTTDRAESKWGTEE